MSSNGQFNAYNIDVCLCIDKTGSMGPIIDTVKTNALNLYRDILNALEQKSKHVSQFRIRVIWFGDYLADEQPMLMSGFLKMPDDMATFEQFVKGVRPQGGGDDPEDGLEALAYAIRSDWCQTGFKRRHIIALFTDAPAHDLGYGKKAATYPRSGMPKNYTDLVMMWGDKDIPGEMNFNAKRLLLFAPDVSYWRHIKLWENTVMRSAAEANGLQDLTYRAMIDTIASSV